MRACVCVCVRVRVCRGCGGTKEKLFSYQNLMKIGQQIILWPTNILNKDFVGIDKEGKCNR